MNGYPNNHHKPLKRVENLARTGIEYPLMKEKRHFITTHKEFEPLSDQVVPTYLLDEYLKNDNEHALAPIGQYPVVYDCIEPSPFYDEHDPYIDERDAIELPPVTEQTEGLVNEPY